MAPNARDIYVHTASSSSTTPSQPNAPKTPVPPRPSASIILLSPTNEILLLHRVRTSSSFPSAHVFPGGNLSTFHEPALPAPTAPDYHTDSEAYRLAALRETFEESGILLAKPNQPITADTALVQPAPATATAARKAIHANKLHFATWVQRDLGARLCADELVPFTRWITPAWSKGKRFTTQMYLFFMPLASPASSSSSAWREATVPTSDGGIEHTAATFAAAGEWLARQARGEIVLFPPQCFLLTMVARVFAGVGGDGRDYEAQREALVRFVRAGTGTAGDGGGAAGTAGIPWTEKVISPEVMFRRESDGRLVLGVDKPGWELKGSGRGGDWERVVLVNFGKEGPTDVEVRDRQEVLREHKAEIKDKIEKL